MGRQAGKLALDGVDMVPWARTRSVRVMGIIVPDLVAVLDKRKVE